MTANYFMVTKDGVDLYADYLPFAGGSAALATAVTDKVRKPTRVNLINGSFETNLNGWKGYSPSDGMANVRSTAQAYVGAASQRLATTSNGAGGFTAFGETQDIAVTPGRLYEARCRIYATIARTATVRINWYTSAGAFISQVTASATAAAGAWTEYVATGTVPANAATGVVSVQAINLAASTENVYLDDVWLEEVVDPLITGVPADLASLQRLFKAKGQFVQPRDIIAPTGFVQSVFRAVRDPAIVTDDSGNTLGTQIYNHGWLLGSLVSHLAEQDGYGGNPIPWPADGGYKVVPVTGTPAVNDGAGTYGFQAVTWPGSSVGVGTLRQVVSGDEGSTHKVAAILDLLAATTNVQRDTIESTYTSTKAAVDAARLNLFTVLDSASDATKAQFYGRADLAWYLACQAVDAPRGPSLENALLWAMHAVVAKEAGLIGATFTTANYETMTQPIDAVLAMPSGY